MRKRLTDKTLDTLNNSGPRRLEIFDELLPGFGVRVGVNGHKSFFCTTRHLGRMRRFTLGPYPQMSLRDAREAARKRMADARKCEPMESASEPRKLREVVRQFIDLYAKPKNRGWLGTERLLMRNFVPLLEMPLDDIKRTHVVRVLDEIMARGRHGTANHSLSAIKKLMNWALDRGMIEVNPITGLSPPGRMVSRERILTDPEIKHLIRAAEAEGHPFGTLYLVLLYTAQRRGEVSGMRWSEINFDRAIWTIPAHRSKNRLTHEVPLTGSVLEILAGVPRFLQSDLVLTTTGTTPISGFGRAKDRIELQESTSDWRVHDLRRTAASGMARLGVAPHVIEKVLNHKSGQISGVAAVYNRYGYEAEKREALVQWAEKLTQSRRPPSPSSGLSSALTTRSATQFG